jgi:hypothetical protein
MLLAYCMWAAMVIIKIAIICVFIYIAAKTGARLILL